MGRPIPMLKKLWHDKSDAINKIHTKMATCHESEMAMHVAHVKGLIKERGVIEHEMFGDWAPKDGSPDEKEV